MGEVLRDGGDDDGQGAADEIPKCRLIKPGLTGRRGKRALDEWQSILVQNHNTSLQNKNKTDFACPGLSQEISRRNSALSFRVDGQHIFQVCGGASPSLAPSAGATCGYAVDNFAASSYNCRMPCSVES